ncbi:hypothetical protein PR048_009458 [Dryococelus australis]|uniref:Uncharacterized protein n=1 Tax=Dryococelus australis TaxID=614101 RepID=A0ABQ9I017_9NEOP|nr:hypothetical protein PR048_009458 [Dryococelus australis]
MDGRDVKVCQKAFLSLHCISKDRLARLQNSLIMEGLFPKDKCGKQDNRLNKTSAPVVSLIEYHIKSYPPGKSHYSLRDNPDRRYLPEDTTIKYMHAKVLSWYHINDILDKIHVQFEIPCNKNLMLLRLTEIKMTWKPKNQIYELGDNITIYRYLEQEGRKGPNEVMAMILHHVNKISSNDCKAELVLISDGCTDQNKNKTMVHFLYCLVHVLQISGRLTYLLPVRDDFYLYNDQDFSLILAQKRKLNQLKCQEHEMRRYLKLVLSLLPSS